MFTEALIADEMIAVPPDRLFENVEDVFLSEGDIIVNGGHNRKVLGEIIPPFLIRTVYIRKKCGNGYNPFGILTVDTLFSSGIFEHNEGYQCALLNSIYQDVRQSRLHSRLDALGYVDNPADFTENLHGLPALIQLETTNNASIRILIGVAPFSETREKPIPALHQGELHYAPEIRKYIEATEILLTGTKEKFPGIQ